uniref:Soluble scavenger receptor cysteine-rich domain-containing protein SSC5D n=1 Tax=Sparus aurata TaxID=8175 RepID=A0A671VT53_SPAAU
RGPTVMLHVPVEIEAIPIFHAIAMIKYTMYVVILSLDFTESLEVRVVNSKDECSGRVEVHHGDVWQTVCDTDWTLSKAQVVCDKLECGTALNAPGAAHFGQGNGSVVEASDSCFGNTTFLQQCSANGFQSSRCGHDHDAGVQCAGTIRLASGSNQCSGRVEIFYKSQWGTVCDDQWELTNAYVVCRELGCGHAVSALTDAHFGRGSGPIWLDDVECTGQESALSHCNHNGFGENNCGHGEDAGVICLGKRPVINGSNRCNGRLEVYHEGHWKRICSGDWGKAEADVVCQEINCGTAVTPTDDLHFGEAREAVGIKTSCFGNESSISQCKLQEFKESCVDATVFCASDKPILMNGTNRCNGQVELFHNGQWGTVCDDRWGMQEAAVVCREMNCGNALYVRNKAFFGRGRDQVWLDDVECSGHEKSLVDCRNRGLGEHNCDHSEDAGVVCSASVRLFNGTNHCSGRVEVMHDGQWGTVCDDEWDLRDAEVVCRVIVCGTARTAKTHAFFGPGQGDIWLDDVGCLGNETSLMHCRHWTLRQNNCGHGEDAGVVCTSNVRLSSGHSRCVGRVEYYNKGQWGTVCSESWDMNDATVLCRQLDCGRIHKITTMAEYGSGIGQTWTDEIECNGLESTLAQCPRSPFIDENCNSTSVAGVVCTGKKIYQKLQRIKQSSTFNLLIPDNHFSSLDFTGSLDVRVVNSKDECSGRVEVRHGDWGTVCDDEWEMANGDVVCRQLGCGHAISAPTNAHFGRGSDPVWLDDVECTGQESALSHCNHNRFGESNCWHGEDAGVICFECDKIKLVGPSRCSGRVEVHHSDSWGTVCDDQWNTANAEVVCREIDCGTVLEAKKGAFFGEGNEEIWLDDVQCAGHESSLLKCEHRPFGQNNCDSKPIRLMNGTNRCNGRVELFHDGQWGTVCDDKWGMQEAAVVCHEMNCGNALSVKHNAFFGRGRDQVWLDDVECSGHEKSLVDCPHRGLGEHNCDHNEDAGVVCSALSPTAHFKKSQGHVKVFLFHVQVRRCKVSDVCFLSNMLELDGTLRNKFISKNSKLNSNVSFQKS